jgi:hypothetical protein
LTVRIRGEGVLMWPFPFPVFPVEERQTNGMKGTVGHLSTMWEGGGGGV